MKLQAIFVCNRRSSMLHERFLIASVATVLVIRMYLAATGYPQLGGGGLHISHMLWGGLDMLIALVLSLTFLGRRIQVTAALLGGIGFGAFIDELGKFITSNNDYFFQPTLVLIYIIYIVLLLSFRILESSPHVSEQECLTSALNILQEVDLRNLHEQDKKEILLLLRTHGSQEPHLNLLATAVEHMPSMPDSPPGVPKRVFSVTRDIFQRLVASPRFAIIIILFFVVYALLLFVLGSMYLVVSNVTTSFIEIGWLASSFLSYIMILLGILFLRRSRLAAYVWFKRAILVSIFLTQSFLVCMQPLNALYALLVNLIVLAVLNSLIRNCSPNSSFGS